MDSLACIFYTLWDQFNYTFKLRYYSINRKTLLQLFVLTVGLISSQYKPFLLSINLHNFIKIYLKTQKLFTSFSKPVFNRSCWISEPNSSSFGHAISSSTTETSFYPDPDVWVNGPCPRSRSMSSTSKMPMLILKNLSTRHADTLWDGISLHWHNF